MNILTFFIFETPGDAVNRAWLNGQARRTRITGKSLDQFGLSCARVE